MTADDTATAATGTRIAAPASGRAAAIETPPIMAET